MRVVTFSLRLVRVEMFAELTPRVVTFAVTVLLKLTLRVATFPVRTPRAVMFPVVVLLV